ncbi:MAG: type II secretion system protein [Bacteroidota bacterium]
MNHKSTIKGFTLIEMLMSIALVSLVFVIGDLIWQGWNKFQDRTIASYDMVSLQAIWMNVFEHDIALCETISSHENTLILYDGSHERVGVYEHYSNGMIRRTSSSTDTLRITGVHWEKVADHSFRIVWPEQREMLFSLIEIDEFRRRN